MALASTLSQLEAARIAANDHIERQVRVLDFLSANKMAMAQRSLERLRPSIMSAIQASNLSSAGLTSRSGILAEAIANPEIVVTKKGIRVQLPRGLDSVKNKSGKSAYNVYKQAAALKYGAVRGEGGARFKKALKKSGSTIAGSHVISAHPFFKLSDVQISGLQKQFNTYMQEEMDRAAHGG